MHVYIVFKKQCLIVSKMYKILVIIVHLNMKKDYTVHVLHITNITRRFISLIKVLSVCKIVSSTFDKPSVYACESIFCYIVYVYVYINQHDNITYQVPENISVEPVIFLIK